MSKLKDTSLLIEHITAEAENNILNPNIDRAANVALLADIAKSLAMIADKLCDTDTESEDKT